MPGAGPWVDLLGEPPWVLAALYAAITADGVVPLVPSESVLIGLAALPAASGRPDLWLLGVVAGLGAFTGDQLAYAVGRRMPLRSLRTLRSARAQTAVHRAEAALLHRGAAVILGARFLPGVRVGVAMAAGASGMSRRRFMAITAVAAVLWSAYALALGVGAGHLLDQHHPLVGVVVAVTGGLLVGVVVDQVLQRVARARDRRRPPA